MIKQVKHFSIHQSSKVLAFLGFLISAIIYIPVSIIGYLITYESNMLLLLLLPFAVLILGYISHVIIFWGYNIVASIFGGLEFDLRD